MIKTCFLPLATLLLVATCQSPQSDNETSTTSTITLSGTITHPKGKQVTLRSGDEKLTADLDSNGVFNLDVTLDKAGLWGFGHGGETTRLYLQPDKNLSLSLDTKEFDESLTYEGDGAPENNYLGAKYLLDEQLWKDRKDVYSMEEATFVEQTNEIRRQMSDQLKTFEPQLVADFAAQQTTDLLYSWAQTRLNYQDYNRYYTKNEDFQTSDTYGDFMKELSLDDEIALEVASYKNFLSSLARKKAGKQLEKKEDPTAEDRIVTNLETVKGLFSNEKIRNTLLYEIMDDLASYEGSKATDKILATYKSMTSDQEAIAAIEEKLVPWAKLKTGMPAPDFKYATINGEQVALSDLKGKSVYIDVWATWCGPCRKEMPSLEALETKYKDSDHLVFASVSIDEDKAAWEKMVTEKEMKGIQLFADKAWESKICKDYLIKGIPRFMIVGSDGNLIDADAPRPSSDEVKVILADLAKPGLTSMK